MTKPQNIVYIVPGQNRYRVYKHSDDVKDYQINWQEVLETAESINTQTVTGKNVSIASESSSGQVSTIFVSGGDVDHNAYMDIQIVTDNATPRTYNARVYFQFEYPEIYDDSTYYT